MANSRLLLTNRRQALQWVGASLGAPLLAATANAQTPAAPTLKIGFLRHYEPYSFLDENQRLIGFDVDVSRRLCTLLGANMHIIHAGLLGLKQQLNSQGIAWVGNQLLRTPENHRDFDFVQPAYANIQLCCVQHENDPRDFLSLDDLVGKRLGVLMGSGVEQQARGALGRNVIGYERIEEGLRALAEQKIDAVLEENLIAEYYIELHRWPIKVTAPFAAPIPVGLPVRKGDDTTRQQLAQATQTMLKDGSFKAISEQWFGYDVSRSRVSPAGAALPGVDFRSPDLS